MKTNIVTTLFSENEIVQLTELYSEAIRQFNYDIEINPFAYPDHSEITDFINNKFEQLTDKLAKELTNEIVSYLI